MHSQCNRLGGGLPCVAWQCPFPRTPTTPALCNSMLVAEQGLLTHCQFTGAQGGAQRHRGGPGGGGGHPGDQPLRRGAPLLLRPGVCTHAGSR